MPATHTEIIERFYNALFANSGSDYEATPAGAAYVVDTQPSPPEARRADEQFVAWVLGYGYGAGHQPRPQPQFRSARVAVAAAA